MNAIQQSAYFSSWAFSAILERSIIDDFFRVSFFSLFIVLIIFLAFHFYFGKYVNFNNTHNLYNCNEELVKFEALISNALHAQDSLSNN